MSDLHQNILLILDDRELVPAEINCIVGPRHFGDIIFKGNKLITHFREMLPEWARERFFHLRAADDMTTLRGMLELSNENLSICVIAGRAGFREGDHLRQLIERIPYAEEDFTDRLYKPLLVFIKCAHELVGQWSDFENSPIHTWDKTWHTSQRVQSVQPLDLAKIGDFLSFSNWSTATRYFNQVQIDDYYYTKQSSDRHKILAEYSFYNLAPEAMRAWLIQPFDYQDDGKLASYKMMRYYLSDVAMQWVHGAFTSETFESFLDRLLFFIAERPQKPCDKERSIASARELFVTKLEKRMEQFFALDDGKRINSLVACANPALELGELIKRYLRLYKDYEKRFTFEHMVAGHGDPCFSNILYDQQRYILKLIDPKGAVKEEEVWTHPLYDICKISHSIIGDYDFINSGLYSVGFTDSNDLSLDLGYLNHASLKPLFTNRLKAMGYDKKIIRLGEASLFLSMLPLHIDYPTKVMAFILRAKQILDEVEFE